MIIFVLALIVLGPEKLPRVVSEVGRWVGRARAMARQFREQLEEEVQLEEARKAQAAQAASPAQSASPAQRESPAAVEPLTPRPDTYSHAHPTDATGADPRAAAPAGPTASADERGT
ncbi:MAG: Sec-independent protein translocase protein TatB [Steroidobacteraceae bacterium]